MPHLPRPVPSYHEGSFFRASILLTLLTGALLQSSCGDAPSALDPQSPRAERVANLSWLIFGLGTIVFVVVVALLFAALYRGSRSSSVERRPSTGNRMIVLGGIVVPAIMLTALMGVTVRTGLQLRDPDEPEPLVIDVIGWQYWWEIRYPEYDIVTANEIHVPTDREVQLRLSSVDVIHSFWLPQISWKLDLIPGQTNTLWIEAPEAGRYRGQCAEFCGVQHAKMAFHLVAESPADFGRWLEASRAPATTPDASAALRGRDVFFARNCSACHGIAGTEASGTAAPDLTHLMLRGYIASGTLPNTPENLERFVTQAQDVKPGSSMPSFDDLDQESRDALIAYLLTLD